MLKKELHCWELIWAHHSLVQPVLDWSVSPDSRAWGAPSCCTVFVECLKPWLMAASLSPPLCSDRLRTMTNVLGDSIGAAVIEHLSQRELELQEAELTLPSLGKPYKSLMAHEKGASRGRGGNESAMWEPPALPPREEGRGSGRGFLGKNHCLSDCALNTHILSSVFGGKLR